ncbi:hypothetical protein [Staphylococcus phage vB_StaM_SA1]|nr:hypothetical protein [Staphylococcus phage vB_StaM_SA1]
MTTNKDLLTESVKKLLKINILNEAEDDETGNNTDSAEDSSNEETPEDNTDNENEEEESPEEENTEEEEPEENSEETEDTEEEPSEEESPEGEETGEEVPEEESEPEKPKETNSDKYLKLQIFNELNKIIEVSNKFKDIINEKNLSQFDGKEKEEMTIVTIDTTNDLEKLIDSINLFNNKFINNIDADKCEKLYKRFEDTYKEIFNNYLKLYKRNTK